MDELYTCGVSTVVPGREEDFVTAWSDLAQWTTENTPGSRPARLLQQREQATRFAYIG